MDGKEIKIFSTTEFFSLPGVEEMAMEMFDGVRLTRHGEWPLEKIEYYRERGKEVVFHSGHGIGLPIWDERGVVLSHSERLFNEIRYVRQTGMKDYSLPLGFTCSEVEKTVYGFNLPAKQAKLYTWREFFDQVIRNMLYLRRELPEVRLAVENLDYHGGGAYECCSAQQVSELIKELSKYEVGFLLDFGHIEVSAMRRQRYWSTDGNLLDQRTAEYISLLPLEQINWVHFHRAGISSIGEVYDAHNAPTQFEACWLKKFPNLEKITLEHPHNITARMKSSLDMISCCLS